MKTQRLELQPFKPADQALFLSINQDPFVRKFLWDDEIIDEAMAREIMAKNEELFSDHGYGLWKMVLRDTKEVIGYTGLWFFFDEPQPQLIYALLEAHSGQGYATEAGRAIIDYAFGSLGFEYLLAATDSPHTASQRVAERLGMNFVEERVEDDKFTRFYKIKKEQWNSR